MSDVICPTCNEGLLIAVKNVWGELCLQCEECDSTYPYLEVQYTERLNDL